MKKLLLITLLTITLTSYSQVFFGAEVGYTSLSLKSDSFKLDKPATGFEFGLGGKYLLSDKFTAFMNYSFFINKFDFGNAGFIGDDGEQTSTFSLKGMRGELLGNYNFTENVGVVFGPNIDILMIGQNMDKFYGGNEFSFGITGGVVGSFDKISLMVKYSYGLNKPFEIHNSVYDYENNTIKEYDITASHNVFTVGIIYYFREIQL